MRTQRGFEIIKVVGCVLCADRSHALLLVPVRIRDELPRPPVGEEHGVLSRIVVIDRPRRDGQMPIIDAGHEVVIMIVHTQGLPGTLEWVQTGILGGGLGR